MTLSDGAFEMFDYFVSLREGILDAWDGAILAMKHGEGMPDPKPPLTSAEIIQSMHCVPMCTPSLNFYILSARIQTGAKLYYVLLWA